MTIRLGINGFGRMGRLAVRALHQHPDLQLVHINETKGGARTAAHLLEFDSVHARYQGTITAAEDHLTIDGSPVSFTDHASPGAVPWQEYGVAL